MDKQHASHGGDFPCWKCGQPSMALKPMAFPHCADCAFDWDLAACPDGREHQWTHGEAMSAESGPCEGGPYAVATCARCGVGRIEGLPVENIVARLDALGCEPRRVDE